MKITILTSIFIFPFPGEDEGEEAWNERRAPRLQRDLHPDQGGVGPGLGWTRGQTGVHVGQLLRQDGLRGFRGVGRQSLCQPGEPTLTFALRNHGKHLRQRRCPLSLMRLKKKCLNTHCCVSVVLFIMSILLDCAGPSDC